MSAVSVKQTGARVTTHRPSAWWRRGRFVSIIDAKLEAVHRAWQAASGIERDRQLLGALIMCPSRPLPYWLYWELHDALRARLREHDNWLFTGEHVQPKGLQEPDYKWLRWLVAEEELTARREAARREGRKRLPNGEKELAYRAASERLEGTLAEGESSTIRHAHVEVAGLIRRSKTKN